MAGWGLWFYLLWALSGIQQTGVPPPQPEIEKVQRLMSDGRYDDAREMIGALLAAEGSNKALLHYLLGVIELRQKNMTTGLQELTTARALAPQEPALLGTIAKVLLALDRIAEAETALRELTSIAPGNAEAWSLLGRIYQRGGRFDLALPALREAARLAPQDAPTLTALAIASFGSSNWEEAQRWFDRASTINDGLDKPSAETYASYAHFLLRRNRLREAEWQLGSALKADPNNPVALGIQRALLARLREPKAPSPRGTSLPAPIFENIAAKSGLAFRLENSATESKHRIETVLGGIAVLDFDGDGRLDIYFTNGGRSPSLEKRGPEHWNRLFRNRADGTFEDVTERAGVRGERFCTGVAAADFDNDGHTDLFVAGVDRNTLYRNNGDGTFSDVTDAAGLGRPHPAFGRMWSTHGAWLDFDSDGRLDLLVVNHCAWDPKTEPACAVISGGIRTYCGAAAFRPLTNSLFHNNGDGTFSDVSESSGIGKSLGKGMGAVTADFDGNGFTDILVANESEPNLLFQNRGDGTFSETGMKLGTAVSQFGLALSCVGADSRDLDNDGRPDIFITTQSDETFQLLANRGDHFADISDSARIGLASLSFSGWSNAVVDFNNDGWKDLFSANGHVRDNIDQFRSRTYRQRSTIFLNLADGTFRDDSASAGPDFQRPAAHRGAAAADFDNDGSMDIVVSAIGEPAVLFHNATPSAGNWLLVRLRGHASNRDGIGAKLRVEMDDGRTLWNHAATSSGFASSGDPRVHFGLDRAGTIKRLHVAWPSGRTQVLEQVKANQILLVEEPRP